MVEPSRPLVVRREQVRRTALLLWCLFILYGSFIPFRFSLAAETLHRSSSHAILQPFKAGQRAFSIPDLVSNMLLFVPFGLLVAAGARDGRPTWSSAGLLRAGGFAVAFATLIETGQLFSPGRTASVIDVAANSAGALLGGFLAPVLVRNLGWSEPPRLGQLARENPALLPIVLMVLAWFADSFYPFAITLDVSTVLTNARQGQWLPFHASTRGFWLDPVVDKLVTGALLAMSVRHLLEHRRLTAHPGTWASVLTVAFAASLEVGKLFFVGRRPNADHVVLVAMGSLFGLTIVPVLMRWWIGRWRLQWALLLVALALLTYAELTPFRFTLSVDALALRARRIEWLPFAAYYRAAPEVALFDLWNKLLLSGFVGFALRAVTRRRAVWVGGLGLIIASALEAAQIAALGRHASVGDVLTLGLGAWIGAASHAWWCQLGTARADISLVAGQVARPGVGR
jgi:VanZ family protein